MVTSTTFIRVRYGEVDQMGFLYYGNYALYYEVGRAEMIREFGYPYSNMEKDGVVMPVVKMSSKFLKPVQYDQLIRIETTIKELHPHPFMTFHHKLFNEENTLLHLAEVTLTFFNPLIQKRVDMPNKLKEILATHFQ
ncbi:MAG: thioesterase superfamily protein [Bacteroidetes bacterium OLB11]|nr:MAG: thioesterase superfamily protein [Bacteroidetes bacterium OLB11]